MRGFFTSRGYRAAVGRAPSARQLQDDLLVPEIARLHAENYGVYGRRKMHALMRRQGWDIGRDQTERLMRLAGVRGVRKSKRVFTTRSDTTTGNRRRMTPAEHRDEFATALDGCKLLRDYAANHITDPDVKALTYESALSRAFRAYENFVEDTSLAFLTGEPTASGTPVTKYASPPSRAHARSMLQGSQRFLDWADPSTVTKRGELFLHIDASLPVAVTQSWTTIDQMRRVRNRIAHNSVESMNQYQKVVQDILLVTPTPMPRPGDILLARPQRGPFRGREVLSGFFAKIEAFVDSAIG